MLPRFAVLSVSLTPKASLLQNFVRHHSHVLPPEYFAAADEWGIMVSPELPAAYGNYFTTANRTGQELYVASWSSYIASYRNHPSVFTWTLLNEMYMGANFTRGGEVFGAERFYEIKKRLDPSRLMMDQDGACSSQDVRDSLSFCSTHMQVLSMGCVGYDLQRNCLGSVAPTAWVPNKYHTACNASTGDCFFSPTPKIPIISHETGNYVSAAALLSASSASLKRSCSEHVPAATVAGESIQQLRNHHPTILVVWCGGEAQ